MLNSPYRCLSLVVGGARRGVATLIDRVCMIRRLRPTQTQTLALYTGSDIAGYTMIQGSWFLCLAERIPRLCPRF
jgi:hypothetical protein